MIDNAANVPVLPETSQPKKISKRFVYYNEYEYTNVIDPWTLVKFAKGYRPNQLEVIVIPDEDEIINLDTDEEQSDNDVDDDDHDELKYAPIEILDGDEKIIKEVPDYALAAYDPPKIKLKSNTRVIAKHQLEKLPFFYDTDTFAKSRFCDYDTDGFYSAIVSDRNYRDGDNWYYLVFFDDGLTQYVPDTDIRCVIKKRGRTYAHDNAKLFFEYFFRTLKKSRFAELRVGIDDRYLVSYKDRWYMARAIDIDEKQPDLVLMCFDAEKRAEWLYMGSPRFGKIWKHINSTKSLQQRYNPNDTIIELSSDSEDEEHVWKTPKKQTSQLSRTRVTHREWKAIKPSTLTNLQSPKKLVKHVCDYRCNMNEKVNKDRILKYDPLIRPIACGWRRKRYGRRGANYVAPCGRSFQTIETVFRHLTKTCSILTIDCFSFDKRVDVTRISKTVCDDNAKYTLNEVSWFVDGSIFTPLLVTIKSNDFVYIFS